MKKFKKITAVLLVLITLLSFPFSTSASGEEVSRFTAALRDILPLTMYAMPSNGSSKIYGYSSASLSKNKMETSAWIDTYKDELVITGVSDQGDAIKLKVPTKSGYKALWFKTADIFGAVSFDIEGFYASSNLPIFRMNTASSVTGYGSSSKGSEREDLCIKFGKITVKKTDYQIVAYALSSQRKLYGETVKNKLGLLKSSSYSNKNVTIAPEVTLIFLNVNLLSGVTLTGTKQTKQITATVFPLNASTPLAWSSSNETVATVSQTGKITSVTNGNSRIQVKALLKNSKKSISPIFNVKVKPVASTKITLDNTNITVSIGATSSLNVSLSPKNTTDTVTYTSANSKIATVNKNGLITAIAEGKTTITVKTSSKISKQVHVTVIKKPIITTFSSSTTATAYTYDTEKTENNHTITVSGKQNATITVGKKFYTYYSNDDKTGQTSGTAQYIKVKDKNNKDTLVYVGAAQCFAYARYIQYLLYGKTDLTGGFAKLKDSAGEEIDNLTVTKASQVKEIMSSAGIGAHVRVYNSNKNWKCDHSFVIIDIDKNGFYYTEANVHGANNVCVSYCTWEDYLQSDYKKIKYISYYTGK